MMLEHLDPDCTGRWVPGPAVRSARWPRYFECDRCGRSHDNGPGVYQAAEDENELGAYLAVLQRGEG